MYGILYHRATLRAAIACLIAASTIAEVNAGRLFRRRCHSSQAICCQSPNCNGGDLSHQEQKMAVRSGCICVQFLLYNLQNNVQIYYAKEYDECEEEQCPYPTVVWHSGSNLPLEDCPDCTSRVSPRMRSADARLPSPRSAGFDVIVGDSDIWLNKTLRIDHSRPPVTGVIIHPDSKEEVFVKIFTMTVHASDTPTIHFGIEVESVPAIEFKEPATRARGENYMYHTKLPSGVRPVILLSK